MTPKFINKNKNIATELNRAWKETPEIFATVGEARGGNQKPSPIWADFEEHDAFYGYPNSIQIFAHTQQVKNPNLVGSMWCLDCRKVFVFEDGEIEEYIQLQKFKRLYKMKKLIIPSLVILMLISCGQKTGQFDCNRLTDKKVIYEIAKSIINSNNENIWNLHDIDTTDFFTTEDYFTNSETKNRLVLIGGEAGTSAGTARNLLILFSCTDSLNVIWSEQVSKFTQDDIVDVNGDGIKEIVMNTGWAWMGEIGDYYEIFNFKDEKKNDIFTARSKSVIDGDEFFGYPEFYKRGDTLESN